MIELENYCNAFKKDFTPRITDTRKPVSTWSEKDVLNGEIVDAFVMIFRTRGCSWAISSGCSMCGYFNDSVLKKVSDEDIQIQFEKAMEGYSGEIFVKIFNSGSFFDETEISEKQRKNILNKLSESAKKVSVESRPEYITNKILSDIKIKDFEVGIGLETANDFVRKNAINKGFTFNDYKKAVEKIKDHNFSTKTYVLIKPPFLTEKESIEDAIETVEKIKDLTNTISFNPVNVQRNTFVEYLWKRKKYRPPWLFSIVEILKQSKKITKNVHIKCDISGGGKPRGPHNCYDCDKGYLNAISEFSLSQELSVFNNLDCECKGRWLDLIDIEDLGFGSLVAY